VEFSARKIASASFSISGEGNVWASAEKENESKRKIESGAVFITD
jgi:hypothetical protein